MKPIINLAKAFLIHPSVWACVGVAPAEHHSGVDTVIHLRCSVSAALSPTSITTPQLALSAAGPCCSKGLHNDSTVSQRKELITQKRLIIDY